MATWRKLLAAAVTLTSCAGAILLLDRLADAFGGETQLARKPTQLELVRPPTGLERLHRKASRGDAGAQYRLGVAYRDGHGTPIDYEQATFYFRQAAEQGDAEAQFSLAMRYYKGEGVGKNMALAHKWFSLASEQGHERAAAGAEQTLAWVDTVD
ncbi:MAG: tetratricopeptide repeat protein [Gammaproteobacteria bacterium]|nr:tetratricopeptide repeat protein [Gammaproteobacteria bacterium]MXW44472.1 sel1 repeat family protein [Gammaproteobacteria bacterium]MYD01313.1 sel1 repeat family protein [Gammaproteobacteria bacterium]MYI24633.1 sel1 repeat family protein [Gammaproteobacteria bacterium]